MDHLIQKRKGTPFPCVPASLHPYDLHRIWSYFPSFLIFYNSNDFICGVGIEPLNAPMAINVCFCRGTVRGRRLGCAWISYFSTYYLLSICSTFRYLEGTAIPSMRNSSSPDLLVSS